MTRHLRRPLDVCVAVAGLTLGGPVIVGVAIAVRVSLGSPVLFRQRRLGRGAVPFELLKFRTMRPPRPDETGPAADAARTPRLGRLLRATSLDELPSLVNLLRGDITLVGPRPLPVHYLDRFRDEELVRFDVLPGITGLAQISGRNSIGWDERLALDVAYVRNRSLRTDLRIIARTAGVVLSRRGVDAADGVTMTELPADRRPPESTGDRGSAR